MHCTEFSGAGDTPQNLLSALVLVFFWNTVKFELVPSKAVQTVFVFGRGKAVVRKVVEIERKNYDNLIISVGMKGLELNEIIVIDLLELGLLVSAEDMSCGGQGTFPGRGSGWEGGEVPPGM